MSYCKTREQAEIAKLYRHHHLWLVSWLQGKTNGSDLSWDLAQDTFSRLLRSPDLVSSISNPKGWLARTASNLAVDQVRKEIRERNYLQLIAALPEEAHPSPEQKWQLMETLESIQILLNQIKPREVAAFLMVRVDGMRYQEVASTLGVSLSSVEKYVAKASLICFKASQEGVLSE